MDDQDWTIIEIQTLEKLWPAYSERSQEARRAIALRFRAWSRGEFEEAAAIAYGQDPNARQPDWKAIDANGPFRRSKTRESDLAREREWHRQIDAEQLRFEERWSRATNDQREAAKELAERLVPQCFRLEINRKLVKTNPIWRAMLSRALDHVLDGDMEPIAECDPAYAANKWMYREWRQREAALDEIERRRGAKLPFIDRRRHGAKPVATSRPAIDPEETEEVTPF